MFIAIILFIGSLWAMLPSAIFAVPIQKIEQQIPVVSFEYSTSSTTAAPTDNSLGLFTWNSQAYTSPTVDFEAIISCDSCLGGNQLARVGIFDKAGNAINNIAISTSSSTSTRVRITDIGSYLDDNEEYTVRVWLDASSGTATIHTARLIIVQADSAITDTRNHISISSYAQTTGTSYSLAPHPIIYLHNQNRMSDITAARLQASLTSSGASATAYAALSSNSACSAIVSDSEVSVTGTTFDQDISPSFAGNLSHNTAYYLCLKTDSGYTATLTHAHLIIDQSNSQGIDLITLFHSYNRSVVSHNGDFLLAGFNNQFNPANLIADRKKAYLEAVIRTDGNTGSLDLYNTTDTVSITNSESSTTSSSYSRVTSNDMFGNLPTSGKDLDVRVKNSHSNTTSISHSWLIIELSTTPLASLSFTLEGVPAGSVNNGITTSIASEFNLLPFGHLIVTVPKYAAHQLTVSTNATSGYQVTVKMLSYLQGNYPANNIDPFIASWSAPTTWTHPNGSLPNDNTGWIGANTTDTRVSGWDDAVAKFGPVNSSENVVMYSNSADDGTTVVVTYAIEANIWQPSDLYSGQIVYNLYPLY
jgi:hypothetical protein